jgi:exopolysaccharide biosynthesis operon protein EpsL
MSTTAGHLGTQMTQNHNDRSMLMRNPVALACLLALTAIGDNAIAQSATTSSGPLTLLASYAIETDSNLFRQSSDNAAPLPQGKTSGAEQIGTASLGLNFKTLQGLQQFDANVALTDTKYQNFDYLSYQASNYDAAWRWSVTPEWTGNLATSRKETLNSFADVTNLTQRNVRLNTATTLDTLYQIEGPWYVLAGLTLNKETNDQALTGFSDYSSNTTNGGVQYRFSSGSTIALSERFTSGTYLNRTVPNANLLDDSYRQQDTDLRLHWVLGVSAADFFVTAVNRTHPTYGSRDFSGTDAGASINWALSGKSALSAGYQHTIAAYETNSTNYQETDTITFGPVWQIEARTALRLQGQWSTVSYKGTPSATPASSRKDDTQDITLSLAWQPTPQWNLIGAIQKASRSSNAALQDYTANIVSISAQFVF